MNQHNDTPLPPGAEKLLDAGLDLLAAHGIRALTIDALCSVTAVTKGSFYHHFKSRKHYLAQLLEHWTRTGTLGFMRPASDAVSSAERFQALMDESLNVSSELETSIRAWARYDAMARAAVEQVDELRLEHLRGLHEDLSGDPEQARLLAHIGYAVYVGSCMVAPPYSKELRKRMARYMREQVYKHPTT